MVNGMRKVKRYYYSEQYATCLARADVFTFLRII